MTPGASHAPLTVAPGVLPARWRGVGFIRPAPSWCLLLISFNVNGLNLPIMLTTSYLLEAFRVRRGSPRVFLVPGRPHRPVLAGPGRHRRHYPGGGGPRRPARPAWPTVMPGPAVALASVSPSAGPGITNMVTAVAAARTDFSPVVVISGQVPTNWEGRGGFQDSSPAALNDVAVLHPSPFLPWRWKIST